RPAPDLHDQFILQRENDPVPGGWQTQELAGWQLAAHPNLPVAPLVTRDGVAAGWLLGYAIAGDAGQVRGAARRPFAAAGVDREQCETWLYRHGGRFAAVLLAGGMAGFYLDPCGSLSAVYVTDGPRLASTGSALHFA